MPGVLRPQSSQSGNCRCFTVPASRPPGEGQQPPRPWIPSPGRAHRHPGLLWSEVLPSPFITTLLCRGDQINPNILRPQQAPRWARPPYTILSHHSPQRLISNCFTRNHHKKQNTSNRVTCARRVLNRSTEWERPVWACCPHLGQ